MKLWKLILQNERNDSIVKYEWFGDSATESWILDFYRQCNPRVTSAEETNLRQEVNHRT